jgi:hypothetical protein
MNGMRVMTTSTLETFPADLILSAAGIKGIKSVASGKYRLSEVAEFGGAYWATHLVRDPRDEFGVQFSGIAGLELAEKYGRQLLEAGFVDRDKGKGNGKATFVRSIIQRVDGSPNAAAIQKVKADLDRIFGEPLNPKQESEGELLPRASFVDAFRGSLPFFIDLDLPPREIEPARELDL